MSGNNMFAGGNNMFAGGAQPSNVLGLAGLTSSNGMAGGMGSMNMNAMPFVPNFRNPNQNQFGVMPTLSGLIGVTNVATQPQQQQRPSGQTIALDQLVPITTSAFLQQDLDEFEPEWYRLSYIEITPETNVEEVDRRMFGPTKRKRKRKKKRNRNKAGSVDGAEPGEGEDADGSDGDDDDDDKAAGNKENNQNNKDGSAGPVAKSDQNYKPSEQKAGTGTPGSGTGGFSNNNNNAGNQYYTLQKNHGVNITPQSKDSLNTTPKPGFVDFLNHFTPKSAAPAPVKPVTVVTPGKAAPGMGVTSGSATTVQQGSSSTSSSSNSLAEAKKQGAH